MVVVPSARSVVCPQRPCSLSRALAGTMSTAFSLTSSLVRISSYVTDLSRFITVVSDTWYLKITHVKNDAAFYTVTRKVPIAIIYFRSPDVAPVVLACFGQIHTAHVHKLLFSSFDRNFDIASRFNDRRFPKKAIIWRPEDVFTLLSLNFSSTAVSRDQTLRQFWAKSNNQRLN